MEQSATTGVSPSTDQALPRRKWISLKWTIIAIVMLFSYFAWQCGSGMNAAAHFSDDAVRQFHTNLDSESYEDIIRDSDEAFQNSESHDELIKFLTGVHSKLGRSRDFTRANVSVNAMTSGTFVRVIYKSAFVQGNAVETFTWRKAGGNLKLVRYDVNSNVFLTR